MERASICSFHEPPCDQYDRRGKTPASPVSRADVRPDQVQVSRRVSTIVRHGETPETALVRDLVRTHTSPEHENGPQAELAGR